ncbi:hypothetical protein HDV05_005208 [Chytridiales sp. JEL 0842]|nr:hypothetical protein HDV05_005208 [Chytridiales sp. JEL 0842]
MADKQSTSCFGGFSWKPTTPASTSKKHTQPPSSHAGCSTQSTNPIRSTSLDLPHSPPLTTASTSTSTTSPRYSISFSRPTSPPSQQSKNKGSLTASFKELKQKLDRKARFVKNWNLSPPSTYSPFSGLSGKPRVSMDDWGYDGKRGPTYWSQIPGIHIGNHQSPIDFLDDLLLVPSDIFQPDVHWFSRHSDPGHHLYAEKDRRASLGTLRVLERGKGGERWAKSWVGEHGEDERKLGAVQEEDEEEGEVGRCAACDDGFEDLRVSGYGDEARARESTSTLVDPAAAEDLNADGLVPTMITPKKIKHPNGEEETGSESSNSTSNSPEPSPTKLPIKEEDANIPVHNTGTTVKIVMPPTIEPAALESGEYYGGYIDFENKRYWLKQFHFHAPSEHKIRGQSFDMEVHFVHATDEKELLVLGLFLQIAKDGKEPTTFFDSLLDHIPNMKSQSTHITDLPLPHLSAHLLTAPSFYVYQGSLTTPPLTEGVQWILSSEPVSVKRELVEKLKSAMPRNNVRPAFKSRGGKGMYEPYRPHHQHHVHRVVVEGGASR